MILFVQIFMLSYLWGSLPSPRLSQQWQLTLIEVAKGAFAILFARYLNNTGLTMTIALIGLLAAHSWSPIQNFRERQTIWVGLGALLAFSPFVAGLVAGITLLVHLASGRWRIGLFASTLLLPLLMWHFRRADIYIIFGIIQSLLFAYQLIPLIMEPERSSHNRLRFRQALIVSIILVVSGLTFFNRYVYRGFGMQVDIIRRGSPEFMVVALTFDDGPDPRYTPGILDVLKDYQVPATFFMVGRHVEMYPDIARRIAAEGHGIGNHTWTHRSLVPLSHEQSEDQIMRTHRVIEEVTGQAPIYFRPPRGVYSQYARDLLRREGYTLVLWDVTSQDWAEIPASRIASNVLNTVRPGSIILLHDSGNLFSPEGGNRINTLRALPMIIQGLRDRGYTIIGLEELIILAGLTGEEEEGDWPNDPNQELP